jgi:hypothetical protein
MSDRFVVVDGTQTQDSIQKKIWAAVKDRLAVQK